MGFNGNKAKVPNKVGWVIIKDKSSMYLNVIWNTQLEAERAYIDLLKNYPENHEWRNRLSIGQWPLKKQREHVYKLKEKNEKKESFKETTQKRISHGGKAPYGYKVIPFSLKLEENIREQRIIARIVRYRNMNITITGIQEKLKYDKTKNREGKPFTEYQIKQIISRLSLFEEVENESTKRNIHDASNSTEDTERERIGEVATEANTKMQLRKFRVLRVDLSDHTI